MDEKKPAGAPKSNVAEAATEPTIGEEEPTITTTDIENLRKALNAERRAHRSLQRKADEALSQNASHNEEVERWKSLGDYEQIKGIVKQNAPKEDTKAILARERDTQNKLIENHKAEISRLSSIINDKSVAIDNMRKDSVIRVAAEKAGVFKNVMNDVVKLTQERFKIEDGTNKVAILDEDGYETAITPYDFFDKQYRAKRPEYFQQKVAQGSGLQKNTATQHGKKYSSRAKMTIPQRAEFIHAHGKDEYFKLPV